MELQLSQVWRHRRPLACLLWPLSLLYRLVGSCRLALYQARWLPVVRLPVPVIVVGNVIAGGAGKTPLVMALVRHLQEQGLRPGVISRGHGRSNRACLEVLPQMTARDCGDEPLLIRQRTAAPVFVASDRVRAGLALLQSYPAVDVIVADDGLQHHHLWRDINIAVFDERGLGNGWQLPAGPLRERWPRKTRSIAPPVRGIDLVVASVPSKDVAGLVCRRELAQRAYAPDGSSQTLQSLRGQRLHALAGIAKPEQFFEMLRQKGLQLEQTRAFPDHHDYTLDDLPSDPQVTVLMTEKDAVKIMPLHAGLECRLLAVPLQLDPEPAIFEAIHALLPQSREPAHPIPSGHGQPTP